MFQGAWLGSRPSSDRKPAIVGFGKRGLLEKGLSTPKSQRFLRFAIAMPIADPRNR